jgi:hypothetical protein
VVEYFHNLSLLQYLYYLIRSSPRLSLIVYICIESDEAAAPWASRRKKAQIRHILQFNMPFDSSEYLLALISNESRDFL